MPLVTEPVSPSGEPMATTSSPTARLSELPSEAVVRFLAPLTLIRARSLSGSVPTTSACFLVPSLKVTSTEEAPATTWLLVTISPSGVMTTPEPVDSPLAVRALISTIAGVTALATAETLPLLLAEPALTAGVVVLVCGRSVALPMRAALPPPIRPEASATAAISATGRRARRRGAGAPVPVPSGPSGPPGPPESPEPPKPAVPPGAPGPAGVPSAGCGAAYGGWGGGAG